jgi:threonine dehydrogenase-like Zn-dependent dehydrogenase
MDRNKCAVLYYKTPLDLRIEDRPIPVAGPGSVVIKVLVCTLLGNSARRLAEARTPVPLVPGACTIGRVFATGPDATKLAVGQLVLIDDLITARDDPAAQFLFGREQGAGPGAAKLMEGPWRDAGLAQYVKCPLENALALDERRLCAELGHGVMDLHWIEPCAVAYAGLRDAGIQAGDRVVVGPATGRYGAAAVAVALTVGAQVVALGRSQATLDALWRDFGSPSALRTAVMQVHEQKDYTALRSVLDPHQADIFVDFSPARAATDHVHTPYHLTAGIRVLRHGGTCCFMGGIAGDVIVPYRRIMRNNIKLVGRFRCGREHLLQTIKLAESGKLLMGAKIGMENVGTYGLEDIGAALADAERTYEAIGWRDSVHILPHKPAKEEIH